MNLNWLLPPWLAERKPVPDEQKSQSGYGFIQMETQGAARWTRREQSALIRESYLKNPVAYRAVRLVAEAVADVPWHLTDNGADVVNHPLQTLLANPNARQNHRAFIEALTTNLLLSGNAYVEQTGTDVARELHLLRPDRVTIETDGAGWPVALQWKAGGATRHVSLEADGETPAAACHICNFHPLDDVYGFAPLEAAAMGIDIHNGASEWNKALIDNSARPSGALVYAPKSGANLSPTQFERLKSELQEGYQGARQAGRPLLLEGGLDWKPMGLTPKDMDFFEAKNAAARDIALAFGVPPLMIGLPGDATYANYKEANRAFFRLTIMPLASRLADVLGSWLGPQFGQNLKVIADADQVDAMAADREMLWTRIGNADFLSETEKREAVGYAPLDKGSNA